MKRILAFLLCAALCCGLFGTGAGAFTDIRDTAVSEAAEILRSMGILDGFEDGSYRPDEGLTRAQFCKIAVTVLGLEDGAAAQSRRSLFSDVSSTKWYAGYVGLACSKGLVSGYGDGRFGPDDAVTYGQAVTILLRMLGYTDAQVGTLWPRDHMNFAEQLGLSEGVSAAAADKITRGQAAVLFANLLQTETAGGRLLYLSRCSTAQSGVILLDSHAEAEDGTQDCLSYLRNGSLGCVKQAIALPDCFEGEEGTLLLDADGRSCGFLPDGTVTHETVTAAKVTADGMTDTAGVSYRTAEDCSLLQQGKLYNWASAYLRVKEGSRLTVYYNAAGKAKLVLLPGADSEEIVIAPYVSAAENLSYLKEKLGLSGEVSIYKNGEPAALSDLAQNDAAQGDSLTNTIFLSDRHVTGIIEAMSPGSSYVSSVTVSGSSYAVPERLSGSFGTLAVGDRVTLRLTEELTVAALSAVPSEETQVGLLEKSGNRYTVTLPGGVVLSGSAYHAIEDRYLNTLVEVRAMDAGELKFTPVSADYGGAALSVSRKSLGDTKLAPGAVIYEWAGSGSLTEISLSELWWTDTIPAASVSYVKLNAQGQAELLLLRDVTMNAYSYGIVSKGTKAGSINRVSTVTVSNGAGSVGPLTGGGKLTEDSFVGVAVTGANTVAAVVTLNSATAVRKDFNGDGTLLLQGVLCRIADDVQVYNVGSGSWYGDSPTQGTALEQALASGQTLTVYYDRSPENGGMVRIVTVG